METVVIYDTKFGNTEKVAQAIARGAQAGGGVRVAPVEEGAALLAKRPDLLVIGGPTQRRSMSPGLRAFVDALSPSTVRNLRVAAFDTRYRGASLIMGSAAADAAKRLGKAGVQLVSAPQGFYIGRGGPLEQQSLEAGELERAEAWGQNVVAALEGQPV